MPIKEIQHICCDHCEPLGTWHAAHSTGCPPQPPQKRGKCVICNNEEPKTGHGDINAYCEKHWDYRFEYFPQPKAEWVEEIIPYLRKHSSGWGFVTDESIKMFEEQFVIPTISHAIKQAREGYKYNKLYVTDGKEIKEIPNATKDDLQKMVNDSRLQERQRVLERINGMRRIYGEKAYLWPVSGKLEMVKEDFDGTNERQYIKVYNKALSDAIKEIKAQDIK